MPGFCKSCLPFFLSQSPSCFLTQGVFTRAPGWVWHPEMFTEPTRRQMKSQKWNICMTRAAKCFCSSHHHWQCIEWQVQTEPSRPGIPVPAAAPWRTAGDSSFPAPDAEERLSEEMIVSESSFVIFPCSNTGNYDKYVHPVALWTDKMTDTLATNFDTRACKNKNQTLLLTGTLANSLLHWKSVSDSSEEIDFFCVGFSCRDKGRLQACLLTRDLLKTPWTKHNSGPIYDTVSSEVKLRASHSNQLKESICNDCSVVILRRQQFNRQKTRRLRKWRSGDNHTLSWGFNGNPGVKQKALIFCRHSNTNKRFLHICYDCLFSFCLSSVSWHFWVNSSF